MTDQRPRPFPVLLTFDLDAELLWTSRDQKNWHRPIALSQGQYAFHEALPRVLNLLAKYGITTTFFVPGMIIERNRAAVQDIVDAGHEISHHSYSHRWLEGMSEPEERDELQRGIDLIADLTGRKPAGYRAPAAEFTSATMRLLLEYGFEYSSNFFDRDVPYRHVVDGTKTNLVEFPFAWVLDDAPFFLYSIQLPGRTMVAPSLVYEHWSAEFDGLYAERKSFVIALHPEIIGRPSRIPLLARLIEHIKQQDDVWFARCDELARSLVSTL